MVGKDWDRGGVWSEEGWGGWSGWSWDRVGAGWGSQDWGDLARLEGACRIPGRGLEPRLRHGPGQERHDKGPAPGGAGHCASSLVHLGTIAVGDPPYAGIVRDP